MRQHTFIFFATAILFGAAFLRIADLHRFPPGLHYDEAADMLLSRDIAWYGYQPFPVVQAYSGREALFYYIAAPMLRIFGTHIMAARLTSAFLGILTVAAAIALGRALLGKRNQAIALMAGAWLAVSGPQVWLTRQGFRTSPQPLLEALGLWLLWIALRRVRRWMLPAILAGVFSGLALYVYMAGRVFPLWLAFVLLVLVVLDRQFRSLRIQQVLVFLAALAVTAVPIAAFYLTHLDVFTDRLAQLAPTSQTPTLLESLWLHLGMFFIRGDPLLRYNLDVGRPFFDPLTGLLLLIGLGVAAYRLIHCQSPLEKTSAAFVLLCPLLIAPSVIAVQGFPPSHMRSVAMVPLIFFLPALGATFLGRLRVSLSPLSIVWRGDQGVRSEIPYLLPTLLFLALGIHTWRDYQAWGGRVDLFYDSDGDLNLAAEWLEKTVPPTSETHFYIASKYYEHPTILAHDLDPKRIHWMMDDHLILPPPNQSAIYIFPRSINPSNASAWRDLLASGIAQDIPPGPDGSPAFAAYHFTSNVTTRPLPRIPLYANVKDILQLRGADLPPAKSGQRARALLYWEVLAAPGRADLTPVVVLTDAWNNEIARTMPYFEHTDRWQPGMWIIQNVELDIPPGNPPGEYTVKVAWIGKARQNDYLPLLDDQQRFAGLWAEIKPLNVMPDTSVSTAIPYGAQEILPGIYANVITFPPAQIAQGEHLRFVVNWFATRSSNHDKPLQLEATWGAFDLVARKVLWSGHPVHDTYPIRDWTPTQLILDRYDIQIPPDFPPGDYTLDLITEGARYPIFSTRIKVNAVARTFALPSLAQKTDLRFGSAITLAGYEVQKTGDKVTVKLAWRAIATPDRDYTVFVHLVRPDGTIFSQQDSPLSRPTSQWVANEVVVDSYTLAAPTGEYTIAVGLYLQESGLRLPVNDSSGAALGDSVRLTTQPLQTQP
jgi:4-amino-4-deoxy-L-arabinose transferase-like glycosyltransferase